jgi:GNAT superfamily N-acetyltransferase
MTISVVPFINDHFPLAEALSSPIYYPVGLWEPHAAFISRLYLYPMGCMSIYHQGTYGGYLFSHPWRGGPIPLGTILNELPIKPDHYYIHDLCIAKPMQRMGLGTYLLNAALERARDEHLLDDVRLMSVLGSDPFWRKRGFYEMYRTGYAPGVVGIAMRRKDIGR